LLFWWAMATLSPPSSTYQRRTPEHTLLYRVVQEHIDRFVAQAESADGAGRLPGFVKRSSRPISSAESWRTAAFMCGANGAKKKWS